MHTKSYSRLCEPMHLVMKVSLYLGFHMYLYICPVLIEKQTSFGAGILALRVLSAATVKINT